MRIFSFLLSFIVVIVGTSTNVSHAKRQVFTCDMHSGSTLQRKASRFNSAINSASKRYGVSKSLIKAVITVESCFNPRATGGLGEKGLMQLMPGTARQLGVRNGYNSWDNIHGGTKYLKTLLKRFNGNKSYAAAAYNGGPGAVSRTRGPKFKQVKRYSSHVMRAYNKIAKSPSHRSSKRSKYKKKRFKKYSKRVRYGKRSKKAYSKRSKKGSKRVSKRRYKSRRVRSRNARSRNRLRATRYKTYRIRRGDTLYNISKRSGVSLKRLRRANRLGRSNNIKIGHKLKLPK